MAQALEIKKIQRESLSYHEETTIKKTYKELHHRKYYLESENLTQDSKELPFKVHDIPRKCFCLYEVNLHFPIKVVKNNNTDYTAADAADRTTPTQHTRLKTLAGFQFIKEVTVSFRAHEFESYTHHRKRSDII